MTTNDNELRAQLREPPARDLEYLRGLRLAALAHIEKVTGYWYGAARDKVVVVTGPGTAYLPLPGPVATGYDEAIVVQERAYPGAEPVTLAGGQPSGWSWDGRNLVRNGGVRWWSAYQYTITYRQGLVEGEEPPDDVRLVANQLVALWYEQRLPVSEAAMQPVPMAARDLLRKRRRLFI